MNSLRTAPKRARRGMTLIELMFTLVITGLLATIGTATFVTLIDHRQVLMTATVQTEQAAALRETLRSWIGSGTIAIQVGGAPTARGGGAGISVSSTTGASGTSNVPAITAAVSTGDELTFTTDALTPSGSPGVRIRLFVDGDPNTPEEGLTIEYQNSTASPLQRRQLDPTILAMTVEFLDQRTSRWYPYSEAATIQPIAARLTFPAVDGVIPPPRLLQLPMVFVMSQQTATTGRGQ
jgi:prepilin-type N-terminal cleavage/methylation domain-containing protein